MKSANEYYQLFSNGQDGCFYIDSGRHARGCWFNIYLLPKGFKPTRLGDVRSHPGVVEVYGVLGGQPGWDEWYGWLHHGPWVDDFERLADEKLEQLAATKRAVDAVAVLREEAEKERVQRLLADYDGVSL